MRDKNIHLKSTFKIKLSCSISHIIYWTEDIKEEKFSNRHPVYSTLLMTIFFHSIYEYVLYFIKFESKHLYLQRKLMCRIQKNVDYYIPILMKIIIKDKLVDFE